MQCNDKSITHVYARQCILCYRYLNKNFYELKVKTFQTFIHVNETK
jgi:hypothetical protein